MVHQKAMDDYRVKFAALEKAIYEKVEDEYSIIIKEKDEIL